MKTVQQLEDIRTGPLADIGLRRAQAIVDGASLGAAVAARSHIMVCAGTGCSSSHSLDIIAEFNRLITLHQLQERISIVKCGCLGLCARGPVVIIYPENCLYQMVQVSDVAEIVERHLIDGQPVQRIFGGNLGDTDNPTAISRFFSNQQRVVLKNCGLIDPENIDEYLAFDGYKALEKVLFNMTPDQVVAEVSAAGLRGRGGGGFPTGRKWSFAAASTAAQKFVLCNADEGDPGAFMDRSLLEGDPHALIEAMIIAGYAIGAHQGFVYVRIEYPIALERLNIALEQARAYGLLGDNIMGSGFAFDLNVRLGAGAFVCGEETALIASVEGRRGTPRPRPPFPAVSGLWRAPTLINNVETYANIPLIIQKGSAWYSSRGTEQSAGTKVFALGGAINNTGLVEIPMGTTLREVVYDIGGGIPGGKQFKAAQTGGPSGGCIPAQLLDTPLDYDSLVAIGSMMGSGGLIVMDEGTCMVDIAKFFLEFTVEESCGKCPPCRIGIKRMLEILERITDGDGQTGDVEKLEELAGSIKATSLCGLGQTASNPVLSTLRYFRDEYQEHITQRKCRAAVCKKLINYRIVSAACKNCGLCAAACPVGAITGDRQSGYVIDTAKCVKCGVCMSKCPPKAIQMN